MTPERAADRLWEPQFTLSQAEKEPLLLARLNLTLPPQPPPRISAPKTN